MDVITQGVIGAAAAGVLTPKHKNLPKWVMIGACGGLAPDLDVFIRSSSDPLLFLDYHRHFTHSIFFIPFGAALVALILSCLFRTRLKFRDAMIPALIGYATHGLLDACTSYGTYLFWPLSNQRVAWNSISIVDPIFTGCLVGGLSLTMARKQQGWLRIATLLAGLYMAFGFLQHERAKEVQITLATERGHEIVRGEVKPSFGNNFLFRSYYQFSGSYYVDAIRIPWLGQNQVFVGEAVPRIVVEAFIEAHSLSDLHAEDLQRFAYFSNQYLIKHPHEENVIGDLRYAFLPNAIDPLWGIEWSPQGSKEHTPFHNYRNMNARVRKEFLGMLKGDIRGD
ncbi:MAG: metal-dependent hydrolase [Myxococcota bacterium]|nr:metal-dependent hydrolase [Myxococcota bacterium]